MAHTFTVTVLEDETYASHVLPSPGYVTGSVRAIMDVVAPVTVAVPTAHAPANSAPPPMLPEAPDRFGSIVVPLDCSADVALIVGAEMVPVALNAPVCAQGPEPLFVVIPVIPDP